MRRGEPVRWWLAACLAMVLAACEPGVTSPSPSPAGASSVATASPLGTSRDAGWEADLRQLIEVRERHHPDPWHGIERAVYVGAVEEVIARIPQLSDDELMVETVRLAAMPTWAGRDGHGGIHPWGEGTYGTHLLPLRLYAFSDGIFVVDALDPHRDLVGEEVLTIGGHDVDALLDAVEPLVPRDNEQQVLTHGMRLMVTTEVLHGLGLLEDPGEAIAVTTPGRGGVSVAPVPMPEFEAWAGGHHTHGLPARPDGPAWIRSPTRPAWVEWQPETGTIFAQLNLVAGWPIGLTESVEERIATGEVERLVLDLRHNPGGDNTTYGPLLALLRGVEEASVPIFVVIGRATFSAAGNLVAEIERDLDATLVGESTGGSPNQFGNSFAVTLEHSGLVFRVAPSWIARGDPEDTRITIPPDLPVVLSSRDYFGDRDPVMAAILGE